MTDNRLFVITAFCGIIAATTASIIISSIIGMERNILFNLCFQQIMTIFFIIIPAIVFAVPGTNPFKSTLMIECPSMRNFKDAFYAEIILLPTVLSVSFVTEAVARFAGAKINEPFIVSLIRQSDLPGIIAIFLTAVVLAPLIEEITFRNVIFQLFNKVFKASILLSALISSAIFTLLHGEWIFFPGLFILGMSFQLIMIYRKSITSSILLHSLHNAISICAILFVSSIESI